MADNNFIEIIARLNTVRTQKIIQIQLNEIAKVLQLKLSNVGITDEGKRSLQSSIDSIQNNIKLNIGSVAIDQSQTIKQAQQISQKINDTISRGADLSGVKRAYNEISRIQDDLNSKKSTGFSNQDELSNYVNNLLKGFKGITTSAVSLNEVNKTINGFKIEVQDTDRVTESLVFHLQQVKDEGDKWNLTSFKSSDNSIKNLEADVRKTTTEFKTLTHYWQMMENMSEKRILGKNQDVEEVQKLQRTFNSLNRGYTAFKEAFKENPQNPKLISHIERLQQRIISANQTAHDLVRTLTASQTNIIHEEEVNKLETLGNNLQASKVKVDEFKQDYAELQTLLAEAQTTGDYTKYFTQLDIFKSKFTEAKTEIKATTAATSELEKMSKSLASNKMNTFFDKNAGNVQVNALKTEISGLINEWTTLKTEIDNTGRVTHTMQTRLDDLKVRMQNATTAADMLQANIKHIADTQRLVTQRQSLDTRISSWLQNNTRASAETIASLKNLQAQIHDADAQTMFNLNNQFRQVTANASAAGEAGLKLSDIIKQKLGKFAGWFSIATVVMRGVNKLKEMYREVVELDTALVDLRKTTDATNAQLEDFYFEANKIGKQLGVTTKEVIQAASSWSRLGYSIKDAQEMAKTSSIFASISPGMTMDEANDALVSVLKAYKIEASDALDAVASKINIVGRMIA